MAVIALVLWLLGPVLMPFVVAAVLAYVLSPLVRGLQRVFGGRLPRLVAVVAVEVMFLLLLVALCTLLIPILAHELPRMRDQLPVLVERLQNDIAPWLQTKGIPVMLDSASIKAFVLQTFNTSFDDGFKQALTSLRIGGSVALAVVGNLVLIPVVLFYLLIDWQRVVRHVESLVPRPARGADVNSSEIVPLVHSLYSQDAKDFVSENRELINVIEKVYTATDSRGVFVLDRGGDEGRGDGGVLGESAL